MKKKTFKDFEDYQDYVNYCESEEDKTNNKSSGEQSNNVYENSNMYYSPRQYSHSKREEDVDFEEMLAYLDNRYSKDWKNPWSDEEEEKEIPKVKKK